MLIDSYRFAAAYDTDAQTYITAVEAADGQSLETGVKDAINAFVVGCKADGIWTAIKASCILAGARTLTGALVPLVGPAPTNVNFVSTDYDRKTGVKGNKSTKYINTNSSTASRSLTDNHLSCFVTEVATGVQYGGLVGADLGAASFAISLFNFTSIQFKCFSGAFTVNKLITGFHGLTRNVSQSFIHRIDSQSTTATATAQSITTGNITVMSANTGGNRSDARIAFYSIGTNLSLPLLDSRVTTLINALAAAIP